MERAQELGWVRRDVEITELLSLVASLPDRFRDSDGSSTLLDVIVRGISSEPSATPSTALGDAPVG